jgi:hypothetical protein
MTTVPGLLEYALALLSAPPPDYMPNEPWETYIPTAAKLRATGTVGQLQSYVDIVRRLLWQPATSPVDLIRRIDRASAVAGQVGSQVSEALPLATVRDAAFRIAPPSGSGRLGRDLASGAADPASAGDPAAAILKLRDVDDVLTRVLAAQNATDRTGIPWPEIMALYRTEGSLGVPPSQQTLALGIPSGTSGEDTHVWGRSLGTPPKWPYFVWLSKYTGKYESNLAITYPSGGNAAEAILKGIVVIDFMLQIAGLDVLQHLFLNRPDAFRTEFGKLWKQAREGLGISTSQQQGEALWDELLGYLQLSSPTPDPPSADKAFQAAPTDVIKFVGGILAIGATFLRWFPYQQPPALGTNLPPLTEPLQYLRYNAHAEPDDFGVILVRALLALRWTTSGARYRPLRNEIAADPNIQGIVDGIPGIAKVNEDATRGMLRGYGPQMNAWLNARPVRVALVSDFLETFDGDMRWAQHRGNMRRYKFLLNYYRLLSS